MSPTNGWHVVGMIVVLFEERKTIRVPQLDIFSGRCKQQFVRHGAGAGAASLHS